MEPIKTQHPKFVRWALMIGIVIILNIFFSVVLALTYPAPKYEAYCPTTVSTPMDAATCDANGGVWTEYAAPQNQDVNAPKQNGYCDLYAKCQKPYQDASEAFAFHAFMVMVGLGILALIIGFIPLGSSIVSTGLSYGGVVALIIGSARYWGTAGNWFRLIIAAIGLIALLYIGWRKFKD